MRGTIYKAAPSITKEEILQNCEYYEKPIHGSVMTFKEFMDDVEQYCITDYDGFGELVLFDKVVSNTSIHIYNRWVSFIDKFFVPFEVMYSIFGDDMKFIWHNK